MPVALIQACLCNAKQIGRLTAQLATNSVEYILSLLYPITMLCEHCLTADTTLQPQRL